MNCLPMSTALSSHGQIAGAGWLACPYSYILAKSTIKFRPPTFPQLVSSDLIGLMTPSAVSQLEGFRFVW